jgi:hypothetical protein
MSLITARDQALFDFDTLLENAPLGALCHLAKPVQPAELAETIESILAKAAKS